MKGYDAVILVDFDNTIHDIKNPVPGRKMGLPLPGAREALLTLKRRRNTIIIFTVRGGTVAGRKIVSDWMTFYKIPYDDITNIKVQSDYIIDDKAVPFSTWETCKLVV
jgi:hypothetical protein